MKKLLEFLVKSIVVHPEDITIQEKKEGDLSNLQLKVHPEDIKIVIGRDGQTIKAIRHLLRIKAFKKKKKFNLILEEA